MKQFVLDHLTAACRQAERITAYQREVSEADLLINLKNGQRVAVCVINRAIRLPEIRARYQHNTGCGIYTVYIIDARMLPDEDEQVEPPYWMAALHTLTSGRIYAYWTNGRDVTIRPLHMEWKWGDSPRSVEYGDEIDMNALHVEVVQPATKYIEGRFASATFGEGAFWKQRISLDEQQFTYSWRNWSYSTGKKRDEEAERRRRESFDPWEEFYRQYGEYEGEAEDADTSSSWDWASAGAYSSGAGQQRQRTAPRTNASERQHYALLGVSVGASLDEVKQAYRQRAREFHPDLHPPEEKEKYTAKMADINAAFEAILKTRQ